MSEMEGREKVEDLIERRRIVDVPMHVIVYWLIIDSVHSRALVGAHSGKFFFFRTIMVEKT